MQKNLQENDKWYIINNRMAKNVEWGEFKMKSKIIKIILIFIMILTIFNTSIVQAMNDPLENPDHYKPTELGGEYTLRLKAQKVLGVINTIGVVLSVATLMIIGIKYMLGSIEEKAEYKKTMLGYVIGAILLFSATTLPNLLYNIVNTPESPPDLIERPGGERIEMY